MRGEGQTVMGYLGMRDMPTALLSKEGSGIAKQIPRGVVPKPPE